MSFIFFIAFLVLSIGICLRVGHIAKGSKPQSSQPQLIGMKRMMFMSLKAKSYFLYATLQQV